MSKFTYRRLKEFDNTGLFCSINETSYFPFHLHDTYCVTLITCGAEILETKDARFITEAGSISIIPAGELHRNYSLTDKGYTYETIYINADLLRYYNLGKKVDALERTVFDTHLAERMHALFVADVADPSAWHVFLGLLINYTVTPEKVFRPRPRFSGINDIIEDNPRHLLNNEWLARQFHLERHYFIREFAREFGVTPQRYIQICQLSKAKGLLLQNLPVQDIAYMTGFYDLSHFSRSFKKVFGLSPSAFVEGKG